MIEQLEGKSALGKHLALRALCILQPHRMHFVLCGQNLGFEL
jgi:hypothetical protein